MKVTITEFFDGELEEEIDVGPGETQDYGLPAGVKLIKDSKVHDEMEIFTVTRTNNTVTVKIGYDDEQSVTIEIKC